MEKKTQAPVVKQLTPMEQLKQMFENEQTDINNAQIARYINALKAFGIAQNLTIDQMYYFLSYCHTLKLNPMMREIHCVCYNNRDGTTSMTPIVSYYEYIKRAEKHPCYQPPNLEWVLKDSDGKELPLMDQYIIGTIQRKGDTSKITKIFYMKEWHKQQGEWIKKPHHMLEVRAIKNLIAVAYPSETSAFETPLESMEATQIDVVEPIKESKIKQIME